MPLQPLEILLVRTSARSERVDTLVNRLITRFEGDPALPFARPVGISVRVATESFGRLLSAAQLRSKRVAVVPLIDDELIDCTNDQELRTDLVAFAERTGVNSAACRFFPAGLIDNWFTLFPQSVQALLRGQRIEDGSLLAIALMQECVAWLRGADVDEPVEAFKVFVSHAKADGTHLAKRMISALESEWRIKGFFDARDIPPGSEWSEVLVESAGRSAMLVLQTDVYAEREWCQREIAIAKRNDVPILVVNVLLKGESRSFPYLGNLPTLRMEQGAPDDAAVVAALVEECLRIENFKAQAALMPAPVGTRYSARAPELVTLLPTDQRIVYPDPPLSRAECGLLPPTVTCVSWRADRRNPAGAPSMDDLVISVSISDPDARDLQSRGLVAEHVDLFWVDLMRALFACDIDVAYGGDHRASGYTERLFNLVRSYHRRGQHTSTVKNYLGFHLARDLTSAQRNALRDAMEIVACELPSDLNGLDETEENRGYMKARAFTAMRRKMARESSARIICGGKTAGFAGRYAGIAEEAMMHFAESKPVYVIGLLGGCAALVAAWGSSDCPTIALNPLDWQGSQTTSRTALVAQYSTSSDGSDAAMNLHSDGERLRDWLQESSKPDSARYNGLDAIQNLELSISSDVDNVLGLLILGITQRFGQHPSVSNQSRLIY